MTHDSKGAPAVASPKFGLDALIGFVGFGALVASFLGLFAIAPNFVLGPYAVVVMRMGCAVALALAFLVIFLASRFISLGKCRLLVVWGGMGFVCLAAALFVPLGSIIGALALYAAASLGLGSLACLWFCFICSRPHKTNLLFVSAAIAAGAVVCLAESYLVLEAARISIMIVWLLSFACMIALIRAGSTAVLPDAIENRDSDKRSKILWTSTLMLSISNFEFGYLLSSTTENFERALCLVVAAISAVVLAINFARKGTISERSLSPLTPPLTMLAFLSVYLFGDAFRAPALCILSVLFTVYTSFGIAAMAEHVRISHLAPLRAYGKARLFDYLGMVFGLMCGTCVVQLASESMLLAGQISAVVAVVYGFIAAFCHKARFPEIGMEGDRAVPEAKGLWKKRCQAVGEQCDLSERQYEVLVLVAQGRNAKYIEQSLSISLSTAQTHIRNIYRKTGVHSRQELLNLIEDTKLYGEE